MRKALDPDLTDRIPPANVTSFFTNKNQIMNMIEICLECAKNSKIPADAIQWHKMVIDVLQERADVIDATIRDPLRVR